MTPPIYNLSSSASLHYHSATVTALSFYAPPSILFPHNLLSADADNSFSLFDANGFIHLKTLPFIHRRSVNELALHPFNKLMLSISCEEFLAMVNLVCGRRSFYCRLDREASLMKFNSAIGDRFFMAMKDKVTVHKVEGL